jgi:hypothetical protein
VLLIAQHMLQLHNVFSKADMIHVARDHLHVNSRFRVLQQQLCSVCLHTLLLLHLCLQRRCTCWPELLTHPATART